MSYELLVISGVDEGKRFVVEDDETLIGRSSDAAVSLSDESVAFEHAVLRLGDGKLFIQNLSALGTTLRGRKLTDETRLSPNDEIELSRMCRLLVEQPDTAAGPNKIVLAAVGLALLAVVVIAIGFMSARGGSGSSPITKTHWRTAYVKISERLNRWQADQRIPTDVVLMFRESWRLDQSGDYASAASRWERLNSSMLSLPTPLLDDDNDRTFAQIAGPSPRALGVIMGWNTSVTSTDFEWNTDEAYADALVWFVRRRASMSRDLAGDNG